MTEPLWRSHKLSLRERSEVGSHRFKRIISPSLHLSLPCLQLDQNRLSQIRAGLVNLIRLGLLMWTLVPGPQAAYSNGIVIVISYQAAICTARKFDWMNKLAALHLLTSGAVKQTETLRRIRWSDWTKCVRWFNNETLAQKKKNVSKIFIPKGNLKVVVSKGITSAQK